jgi:hypothetical protein
MRRISNSIHKVFSLVAISSKALRSSALCWSETRIEMWSRKMTLHSQALAKELHDANDVINISGPEVIVEEYTVSTKGLIKSFLVLFLTVLSGRNV